MRVKGVEWDAGNWPKCARHGVSKSGIESLFHGDPFVFADPFPAESRMRAIGKDEADRWIFVVFTLREREDGMWLRPISARYMHLKEVEHFVSQRET